MYIMDLRDLSLVKGKNSVRLHMERQGLIDDIIKIIQAISNLHKIKNDIEFLRYILELIENGLHKKVAKDVSNTELCFEIYLQLFPTASLEEKDIVKKNIDFLVNNKQIAKVSLVKKLGRGLLKVFLKA